MDSKTKLSVIVPISERYDDIQEVFNAYRNSIDSTGLTHEFIYILDGDYPDALNELLTIQQKYNNVKIIKFAKWFGESVAISAGFEASCGEIIITLPPYLQIDPNDIPNLINELETYDFVTATRSSEADSFLNRVQRKSFHGLLNLLTQINFKDLGCSARAFNREVLEEIDLYGDQHRFLPVLAYQHGFKVKECLVKQAKSDTKTKLYSFGVYIRRMLDIVSIFFLFKFTKKPLRFFGLLGFTILSSGALLSFYLLIDRLVLGNPLGGRPLLLLSSLLVVIGIQIFAIGLIGEIIIFTHAKDLKEYKIEKIIN